MILRGFAIFAFLCVTLGGGRGSYPDHPSAEDGKLSMTQLARKYGYPMEVHTVQTEDLYILTMYRIPHGRNGESCGNKTRTPVLIQHGMISSSFDFIILGPKKALGYLLADKCYDVWLGNNRGNSESKKHVSIKPKDKRFWSFSWNEMGRYDLPAEVDYILNKTGQPSLHYIGHSQGTTQFFVFGSLYPEHQHKIRSMHALSPVVYMGNLKSPIVKFFTLIYKDLEKMAKLIGLYEFCPGESFLNFLGNKACKNEYPNLQIVCSNVIFLLCGFNAPQLNTTILPAIVGHTPAGASVKQLLHYAQGIQSRKFRHFDYGLLKNLKVYKSQKPPAYDVTKIKVPIALYYGANDYLAAVKDVQKLASQLPNVIENYLVPHSKFSHSDFIFGSDVKHFLYDRVIKVLEKY